LRVLALCALMVATPAGAALAREDPLQTGNLLQNPSFEGEFKAHDLIGNIKVAPGWTPWYIEGTEEEQANGYGRVAEFFPATREFYPTQIHEGNSGQGMKHDYGQGAGGIYQQVTVPANARLRFSAWGIGYSCQPDNFGDDCPSRSKNPSYLGMQIAIDPAGGTDFYASRVVFTPGTSAYDAYQKFEVEATAQGTQVTVFIMYHPAYPVERNRVIWDDASLTVVSGGSSSAPTSTPTSSGNSTTTTSGTTSQPATTTTTTGTTSAAATYTVQAGDFLARIAQRNGTTVSALINLNGPTYPSLYSNPNLIYTGWVLKVSSGVTTTTTTGTTTTPTTSGGTYTVQAGDFLARIAQRNGTTVSQLISLNSATYPTLRSNPNLIYTGWVLKLP
jgi:LysM repeat protein